MNTSWTGNSPNHAKQDPHTLLRASGGGPDSTDGTIPTRLAAIGRRRRHRQAEAELLGLRSGRNLRTSGGIGPSAGCRGRQDLRAPTTASETHGALLAAVGAGVGGHVRGRVVHGCGPAPSIEVRGLGACAGCWARGRGVRKAAAHRVEGGGSALADDLSM